MDEIAPENKTERKPLPPELLLDNLNEAHDSSAKDFSEQSPAVLIAPDSIALPTTWAHRGFTVIGCAFVLFEFLFVTMFSDQFWFSLNIHWLGIVAVLMAIPIAHLLLCFQESPFGCHLLALIWKEKPPIVYRHWLKINDPLFAPGIRFGNKSIKWSAIDELELTLLGNLIFKSYALQGRSEVNPTSKTDRALVQPNVVLKAPFGVASSADQIKLLNFVKTMQPNVVLNKRLLKRLKTEDVKGAELVAQLGTVFLFLVLLDVGYSTFSYLETLKRFYLSDISAIAGKKDEAAKQFQSAKEIMDHPLPLSWVTTKLMSQEPVGPGLYQAQADALWHMGRREEALSSAEKAAAITKKSFRAHLKLARMLTDMQRNEEAAAELDKAKESHKDSFLPQLYMVALKQGVAPSGVKPETRSAFNLYSKELDDGLYADEPRWPPGGNRFLHDIWFSEDVNFVFSRLIGGSDK